MANFELRKKAMGEMMKDPAPMDIKKKSMMEESDGSDESGLQKKIPFMVTEDEKKMILECRKEESGESKEEEGAEQSEEE